MYNAYHESFSLIVSNIVKKIILNAFVNDYNGSWSKNGIENRIKFNCVGEIAVRHVCVQSLMANGIAMSVNV